MMWCVPLVMFLSWSDVSEHQYITDAEATMTMIGKGIIPGAYLVDLLPHCKIFCFHRLLKHILRTTGLVRFLPSWLPFNNIHTTARWGRNLIFSMIDRPLQHVHAEFAEGTARPSFVTDCLRSFEAEDSGLTENEKEHILRWSAGAMYGGMSSSLKSGKIDDLTFLSWRRKCKEHQRICW